jgi:hypothetical protein
VDAVHLRDALRLGGITICNVKKLAASKGYFLGGYE